MDTDSSGDFTSSVFRVDIRSPTGMNILINQKMTIWIVKGLGNVSKIG
jgi:hypothetical protein